MADSGTEADIQLIQRILPHRYPFLLVDRVTDIVGTASAIGHKNVTMNEPQFQGHFPGTPIMPGVLMVEMQITTLRGKAGAKVWKFSGRASVNGEMAAEAEFTAMMDLSNAVPS